MTRSNLAIRALVASLFCQMAFFCPIVIAAELRSDVEAAPPVETYHISGRVTNDQGEPFSNIAIDVLRSDGSLFDSAAFTNENGEWSKEVPAYFTYYVRTVGDWTPGYQPEIWNNHPCTDCYTDPAAIGDPVEVTDADVGGIDFELAPIPQAGANTCGANDLIMASNFESPSEYQLTFSSTPSALITAQGQSVEFAVAYLGPNGQKADPSNLEWCLEDDSLLEIDPTGTSAMVTSTGFDITSVDVLVRDPITNASVRGTVVLASLQPEVSVVSTDVYISGETPLPGETAVFRLLRTTQTNEFTIGMIIADFDRGLLGKITGITVGADYIDFQVELPNLIEVLDAVDINTIVEGDRLLLESDTGSIARVSRLDSEGKKKEELAKGLLKCTGGFIQGNAEPTLDFEVDPDFIFKLKKDPANDEEYESFEMSFAARGKVIVSLENVEVSVAPNIKCSFNIGSEIPGPRFYPLFPIGIGSSFQFKGGFEAVLSSTETTLKLPSPQAWASVRFKAGVGWNKTDGTFRIGEFDTNWGLDSTYQPAPPPPSAYGLDVFPYVGLDIKVAVYVLNYIAGSSRMFQVQAGVPVDVNLPAPVNWLERDYVGPNWSINKKIQFEFSPELGTYLEGVYDRVLKNPLIVGELDIETPLLEYEVPWYTGDPKVKLASPDSVDLTLSCTPEICRLDPFMADYLNFRTTTGFFYDSGVAIVDLVGWKDEAAEAEELATAVVQNRSANGTWAPKENQQGKWLLASRWQDRGDLLNISRYFPYASTQKIEVEVTETQKVTVEKYNTSGERISKGLVTSVPEGIDCGETCLGAFPEGAQAELTASANSGWGFVRWADDSDVCRGSDSPNCIFTLDGDKTAKAVFEERLNYTLVFGYYHPSLTDLEVVPGIEIGPGENITVQNQVRYLLGLKLDGQFVDAESGNYYPYDGVNFDLYSFPSVPIGPDDHEYGSYTIKVRDFTNEREVEIPVDLSISNAAYRNFAGRTFTLNDTGGGYVPDGSMIVFEPFAGNDQFGRAFFTRGDNQETTETTWTPYSSSTYAHNYALCGDNNHNTPEDDIRLHNQGGFRSEFGIISQAWFFGVTQSHVYAAARYHFCPEPELQERRMVIDDH